MRSEIRLSSVVTHASPSLHFGVSPASTVCPTTQRTLEWLPPASDRPTQVGTRHALLAGIPECAHGLRADPSVYDGARELEVAPGHHRQRSGMQTPANNASHRVELSAGQKRGRRGLGVCLRRRHIPRRSWRARPGSLLAGRNDGEQPHWGFQDIIMSSYSPLIVVDCRYARKISKSRR
jgi:hypothetical protein